MATIQSKKTRGYKYWYIVESRRINGKPRPVVLSYLGTAENLLHRLEGEKEPIKVKSYAHGAVAALLKVVSELQIPELINSYVEAQRPYFSEKPIRHNLTAGMTLVLAAIGRACMPTSKRKWREWARTTSCEFLLRAALSKVDSQHFWDMMDALPAEAIPELETELVKRIQNHYHVSCETLAYDTTNFFTFIDTTNTRCTLAQRTKSKQKRHDLRNVGLAMVVTKQDLIPLFHLTYQGNRHDVNVFAQVLPQIKKRLKQLGMNPEKQTVVFDRGNNSKKNLRRVERQKLHYVGALSPSHHKQLIEAAEKNFTETQVGDKTLRTFRDKRRIWGSERTVVVLISERLKAGQLRGIYQELDKKKARLRELQKKLRNPNGKKYTREELEGKINDILKGQYMQGLIHYWLTEQSQQGRFTLQYRTDRKAIEKLEDHLGLRILMTDRHDWSTAEIINAYYAQSTVEHAFRNLKNAHHLSVTPQFHWTDQKIRVHFFTCVLAYQLSSLLRQTARKEINFKGSADALLERLGNIRLSTLLEANNKAGKPKALHQLEEMDKEEENLLEALGISDIHQNRPKINEVGVYTY